MHVIWYHLYVESKKKKKKRYTWIYLQNRCINVENKLMLFKGERAEDWHIDTPIYETDKQKGPTM